MAVSVASAPGEGQTRNIAQRVADRVATSWPSATVPPLAGADALCLELYRVILAASIQRGHLPLKGKAS